MTFVLDKGHSLGRVIDQGSRYLWLKDFQIIANVFD